MSRILASALLLALPVFAEVALWQQCDAEASSCSAGASCVRLSETYSQCMPTTSSLYERSLPGSGIQACGDIPASLTLKSISELPDPFTAVDGTKVTTKEQFTCRQGEMSKLLQQYELGTLPPKPSTFTASFASNTLTINAGEGGKSISFTARITFPSGGKAPYPAIIAFGGGSLPTPAGVAMINFNNDDMGAQASSSSRGQGKFYNLYGKDHSAGAMIAWAWGVSRIIDALEITPAANIDVKKLGVTGCSRNGKGAFIAGAFDDRIALTLPQESGSGGSGCWRISDWVLSSGTNTQTASEIIGENCWFSKNFDPYVNKIPTLPVDHHFLAGLVAPRGLYVIENSDYEWLGVPSTYGCMKAGHAMYEALGVPDNMGFSQLGKHSHCQFPSGQQSELNAFVRKFLFDETTNTSIMKTDASVSSKLDMTKWQPWTTPKF